MANDLQLNDIPCIIFAGGHGTRMGISSEETPKPLVEIGGRPILFWLIESLLCQGVNKFYILAGFRQEKIKLAFQSYLYEKNDIEVNFINGRSEIKFLKAHSNKNFNVKIIDTGLDSLTGLRLKQVAGMIKENRVFITYGDGLGNVDLQQLVDVHKKSKKKITITTTDAPERFGIVSKDVEGYIKFNEKMSNTKINIGYMVMEKVYLDYLQKMPDGFNEAFETSILGHAATNNNLNTYYHNGFWRCMDTPADQKYLHDLTLGLNKPWLI